MIDKLLILAKKTCNILGKNNVTTRNITPTRLNKIKYQIKEKNSGMEKKLNTQKQR